jgi:hypothetical protein
LFVCEASEDVGSRAVATPAHQGQLGQESAQMLNNYLDIYRAELAATR